MADNTQYTVFVDNLAIYYNKNMNTIQFTLQKTIHNLESWAAERGMNFSASKTKTIIFTKKRVAYPLIELYLNNSITENTDEIKHLGLILTCLMSFLSPTGALKLVFCDTPPSG